MIMLLLLHKSNFTPAIQLDFWVENENLYVTLAHMVHDIFVIPASSTPVERVFSNVEYALSGRRTNWLIQT